MIPQLIDHLWQSTLFAAAAWLLVLGLRKNRAQVRYWVWFIASVKFLIPFSLFVWIGTQAPWQAAVAQTEWMTVAGQISQPITARGDAVQNAVATQAADEGYLPLVGLVLWASGFAAVGIRWLIRWKRVWSLQQSAEELHINTELPVRMVSSRGLIEPGVFGLFRPVLLLPEGIVERLDPAQLQAILTHELYHVRRKDNLTAAIHMTVEAIFWFHPLVWWLGARLVDERERACDEEVLRQGGDPSVYAEGILNVCRYYVESPLTCVSGVTGSNRKKRIEAIMRSRTVLRLNFAKKAALVLAGMVALTVPLLVGMQAPLRFEVATIKPTTRYSPAVTFPSAGRFSLGGDSLQGMIRDAYGAGLGSNKEVTGGPGWTDRDFYNVEAKAEGTPNVAEYQAMLRTLLAERFALQVHTVPKTVNVYALVLARSDGKLGPGVQPFPGECGVISLPATGQASKQLAPKSTATKEPPHRPLTESNVPPLGCRVYFGGPGGITLEGAPMAFLAQMLSTLTAILGRPVVDRTGLTGRYNMRLELEFPPLARPNGEKQPSDLFAPSLFAALQNQLGVRLESSKGTVETIIVDRAERPTEN